MDWVPYKECSYSNSVNFLFLEKKIFSNLWIFLFYSIYSGLSDGPATVPVSQGSRGAELHGPTSSRVFSAVGARWGPLPPHLMRRALPPSNPAASLLRLSTCRLHAALTVAVLHPRRSPEPTISLLGTQSLRLSPSTYSQSEPYGGDSSDGSPAILLPPSSFDLFIYRTGRSLE